MTPHAGKYAPLLYALSVRPRYFYPPKSVPILRYLPNKICDSRFERFSKLLPLPTLLAEFFLSRRIPPLRLARPNQNTYRHAPAAKSSPLRARRPGSSLAPRFPFSFRYIAISFMYLFLHSPLFF